MNVVSALLATVLPESILGARWFAVLSTFVAINTILYVSMSIFKILPKPYLSDVVRRHGRRAETRSTYPDGHSVPDEGQRAAAMGHRRKLARISSVAAALTESIDGMPSEPATRTADNASRTDGRSARGGNLQARTATRPTRASGW